ncbi:hypothetical protein FACS1894155_09500 [Bacteroidia bacterium]|nr:hypothetical protein FACS1894155_09500 [Bacteroidia bacterium]
MKGGYLSLLYILLVVLTGCAGEEHLDDYGKNSAYVSLSLRASTGINEDTQFWEDRVIEVRMIIADQNGNVVYNDMLKFPSGLNYQCDAVKLYPGHYDFYFIANESGYSGFTTLLTSVTNVSQFQTNSGFRQLQYNSGFVPNPYLSSGTFLMSACYKNIQVQQGGTKTNPVLLSLGTGTGCVELVRALAKVEVIFRKKSPGDVIPNNTITSVQLTKVAGSYSVPPNDNYYTDWTTSSNRIVPSNFDYTQNVIGSVVFYVPEFLTQTGGSDFTQLNINSLSFPIRTDDMTGLGDQQRNIPGLSNNCVIRNFHYKINVRISPQGGIELQTGVEPWIVDSYTYMFQDPNKPLVIPPVFPTDSSVIVPTSCGKIEIRSNNEYLPQGVMGANGDVILWWDPAVQGPNIIKGQPPCYCEQKYGQGWRLINSCELMSFLATFDQAYKIWQSNTWQGINSGLSFYPIYFRQEAQSLLQKLTGADMSHYTMSETKGGDNFGSEKLGMLDDFFTPGDIMITLKDHPYPGNWPYSTPPTPGIENWFPMEVVLQFYGYWYSGYLDYNDPAKYNDILYRRFERYNFSSTISRCVRSVE